MKPILETLTRWRTLAAVNTAIIGFGCLIAFTSVGHWRVPFSFVVLGAITGSAYGLLSVGLVIVYRSSRVINFAHGETGSFAASVFGLLAIDHHVPYLVCVPLCIVVGAGAGALAEVAVIRRLRNAPRVMSVVATLGMGQFLAFTGVAISSSSASGNRFPQPPFMPTFHVGFLELQPVYVALLFFSPPIVLGLSIFLRRSKIGIAIRCAAQNPEAAKMAGIAASRMSALSWAIAGALSAFTAILLQPTRGLTTGDSFGPDLLLRALAGAVLARMDNLAVAFIGGIGLGILEQIILLNNPNAGLVQFVLFLVIVVAMALIPQKGGREEEKGTWGTVVAGASSRARSETNAFVRRLPRITGVVGLVLACSLVLVISNETATTLTGIVALALVGLSVTWLSGFAGELSLGQAAVAGVGFTVAWQTARHSHNAGISLVYAAVAGAVVSVLLGIPALRGRGLMLTVVTLAFGVAAPGYLLNQGYALGESRVPPTLAPFGHPLTTGRTYYLFALGALVAVMLLLRNLRVHGVGRSLIAVRDNPANASAFTLSPIVVKIQAFAVAGAVAGFGGAVYGDSLSGVQSTSFAVNRSLDLVVMAVIGGIGSLSGPILGALFVIGVPDLPLDNAGLAATKLGALLLVLYLPGGFAQLSATLRDRLGSYLSRAPAVTDAPVGGALVLPARTLPAETAPRPLLTATGLRRSFGGIHAVRGVDLTVNAGEVVGLIGPNGAGKTTLFEIIGGFTRPDSGRLFFDGQDVSLLGPAARSRLGLIRSFQDAALFPTLSVLETVQLSLCRRDPVGFGTALAGYGIPERRRLGRAREILDAMGLERYAGSAIQELSTGTRRITELACLVALEPTLLLLDEPSSGIAQRESEGLGDLLRRLTTDLGITVLIIEHDLPLVMGISDRIIAMADGRVLVEGAPEFVRNHPLVAEAYLGGDVLAIERSGAMSVTAADPARTPAGVGS